MKFDHFYYVLEQDSEKLLAGVNEVLWFMRNNPDMFDSVKLQLVSDFHEKTKSFTKNAVQISKFIREIERVGGGDSSARALAREQKAYETAIADPGPLEP